MAITKGTLIVVPGDPEPDNGIPLTTRKRTPITNHQDTGPLSTLSIATQKEVERRYSGARFKGKMDAVYNCHGMTFASRRTRVWEIDQVPTILKEDGYAEVSIEIADVGDVVIYWDEAERPSHSGIVVEIRTLAESDVPQPIVLSKWGDGKEVVHHVYSSPYGTNVTYHRINP